VNERSDISGLRFSGGVRFMPNGTPGIPWQARLFRWIGREDSFERERGGEPHLDDALQIPSILVVYICYGALCGAYRSLDGQSVGKGRKQWGTTQATIRCAFRGRFENPSFPHVDRRCHGGTHFTRRVETRLVCVPNLFPELTRTKSF
jgi:hypothetical protein